MSFTERNIIPIEPPEISIRFDAPIELRVWLFSLVKGLNFPLKKFRGIVCLKSYQASDPNQYSENEYMENEIHVLLDNCKWNYIYDIIEAMYEQFGYAVKSEYRKEVNNFFIHNGYGWKMDGNGQIVSRGDDAFEQSIQSAIICIENSNPDAYSEIKEALIDISKRPAPDITGAIQHSMAAVECLCKYLFGTPSDTLGKIIKDNRDKFPNPLDVVLDKLWGFTSNYGRHVIEGKTPSYEEAELVVHICASLIPYLKKTMNFNQF